jgi:4-hydroxy-tetrahydrodipicolinate reductase
MVANQINILSYGLGPIGIKIMQSCLQNPGFRLIGAVDIDPQKIGKDAGGLADLSPIGVAVSGSLDNMQHAAVQDRKLALHATGSNLEQVWPQIRQLLDHGYSIISTCEQLSYPWARYPELSQEINQYARDKQQFVIGTGVNPGFVMDALTLFATSVSQNITGIRVSRKVDVSKRRVPLQKKVGIGMTPEAFRELAIHDRIGHVGLEESLRLIAYGLNLSLTNVENSIEPTIAWEESELAVGLLKKDEVSGLHQIARGTTREAIPIELDLIMSVGVSQEDRITLETKDLGNVEFVIPSGIFGDTATVNVVVNTAKTLYTFGGSGLLTMADICLTRNVS